MAYHRHALPDPFLRFRPIYGHAEQDKEKVPNFDMIVNHRAAFEASQMKTTETSYRKADASALGNRIDHFKPEWGLEKNSMLYVITEKRGNVVVASPLAVEVGLYEGWKHLQKISLNCASIDKYNRSKVDQDGNPFCYAHQLFFGDVIVVLDLKFYEPPSNQLHQPHCTATSYYVLERNYESSPCLVVREDADFLIFKGNKDVAYPAAPITKQQLLRKIDNLPSAHNLPDAFIINAKLYVPAKKCFRLGHCFNRNSHQQTLVRELLTGIAKLTSTIITNYKPFLPHVQLLTGSYKGQLDSFLKSDMESHKIIALKSLRAAKLQTSSNCRSDRRFVHFVTCGTSKSPTGDLYVKMRTKAVVSWKSYAIGKFVEIDGLWFEPLVGTIVSLTDESHSKNMTIQLSTNCGFFDTDDLMEDNVINHRDSWDQITEMFSGMKNVSVRSFEIPNHFDVLSSTENTFHSTVLGDSLMEGMGKAAESINSTGQTHVEHNHAHLYGNQTLPATSLSPEAIRLFRRSLRHTPTQEQLHVYEKVLDESLPMHVVESAFGSGKTATAAAAAFGRVQLKPKSRVALIAQTNAAVEALLKSSNLPDHFDFDNYEINKVRPLVIQSNNWKFSRSGWHHEFDHKVVMAKVLFMELVRTDPGTSLGSENLLRSIFEYLRHSDHVDVRRLPRWKFAILAKKVENEVLDTELELYKYFLSCYKPNIYYATCDMFVAYSASPYLPRFLYPDLIVLDESTMIQPADLVLMTSKLEKQDLAKPIRYVLFGDIKQLEPYNTMRVLAPVTVSPNKMLLDMNFVPSRLSNVYRCHPAATEVLSKMFYFGSLTSGRLAGDYIQAQLPDSIFPGNGDKAFHFISNNYSSVAVAQSRANSKEAAEVVQYVEELLRCAIQPSSIIVITPYTAQKDLLRQSLPVGVRVVTTRKFQGGECDIVVFSCCATALQSEADQKQLNSSTADDSRIQLKNGVTTRVYLISDPSIILVSLSRSRHFTTVFGNKTFLSGIPLWQQFFELCHF